MLCACRAAVGGEGGRLFREGNAQPGLLPPACQGEAEHRGAELARKTNKQTTPNPQFSQTFSCINIRDASYEGPLDETSFL